MPSAPAKRRKAAKKKQEKIANTSEAQQGNGDSSKSHDEKDSDSGSVSSPTTSREHENPLRKDEEDEEEKSEDGKDHSAVGSVSSEPHDVLTEKSEFGGEGKKVVELGEDSDSDRDEEDEEEVTKEVDFESRVINIESVKEPNVEVVKEEESSFDDSLGNRSQVIEKTIELDPPQEEEIGESKEEGNAKSDSDVVETVPATEPTEEVVLMTKEVILDPENNIVSQSEAVEVNPNPENRDTSLIESESQESEEKILPQSNGTNVETSDDSGHPTESHTPANSDTQQKDVGTIPPIVRPTSWKGCCGLFDVFMGSNR